MSVVLEVPDLPALVVGTVGHARHTPLEHSFTHDHYQWLVDLDDLPSPRWPLRLLARFDPRDHLDRGRLDGGTKGDLVRWLAGRGITVEPDDRVLMLAHARALGHVFDPLTVFWVLRADGTLRALVFEVHNTYRERHAYLVELDDTGRGTVPKAFHVSPFNDVDGEYRVRVHLGPDRVSVRIVLTRDGQRVLSAVTTGVPRPATGSALNRVAARHLFMTWRVSVLIRLHGIWLWLRRLPVQPRTPHSQEAVR